jgi:hypothetical protein
MKRKEKMLKRAMANNPADEKGMHVFFDPKPNPERNRRKRGIFKTASGKTIRIKK